MAVVSGLTVAAARPGDAGFVLGPATLGLGAMLALLLYPLPASAIAIYALAFGDAAASVVGMACAGRRMTAAPEQNRGQAARRASRPSSWSRSP